MGYPIHIVRRGILVSKNTGTQKNQKKNIYIYNIIIIYIQNHIGTVALASKTYRILPKYRKITAEIASSFNPVRVQLDWFFVVWFTPFL